jgi:cell division protein FtsX
MKSWLRHHRQALAAAFGKVAAQKAAAALNALVFGIALSLPAGGYALLGSLRAATGGAPLEPQLSLFMRSDAKRADADALGARLKGDARLRELRFVPREQALKELQASEGLAGRCRAWAQSRPMTCRARQRATWGRRRRSRVNCAPCPALPTCRLIQPGHAA